MRANYNTCIRGVKVILVPYRRAHVEKYHHWMKDPYLLDVTGSEPLSMEEEIAMQQQWKDDEQKCTFIVLSVDRCSSLGISMEETNDNFVDETLSAMCGDVNLFLSDEDDECIPEKDGNGNSYQNPSQDNTNNDAPRKQAELDIMIAEEDCRGRGLGKEAVCLMMLYAAETLGIRRFIVKIKEYNTASKVLFEKKLDFVESNYAECFKEIEYEFKSHSSEGAMKDIKSVLGTEVIQWQLPSIKLETDQTLIE